VGLSSRLSGSTSTLPVGRGSRSSVKLIIDADDEARGSSYLTKPLSSFQRGSRPLRQSYKGGKMKTRYSYLDDIEVYKLPSPTAGIGLSPAFVCLSV